MPFQVTDRKYFYQDKNGKLFNLNTGDYTTNLTGSVMEIVRSETTVECDVSSYCSRDSEEFIIAAITGGYKITRDIFDWDIDGWVINDLFEFSSVIGGAPATFIGRVTLVDGLDMEVVYVSGAGPVAATYTDGILVITSDLLAAVYQYNLIENSDTANYINPVDGSTMMYQLGGLTTAYQAMTPAGLARSWVTGDCEIKRVSFAAGVAVYMIRQDFIILPYYTLGLNQDFIDGTLPVDLFEGLKSLRHVWELRLRASLSNPNYDKVYVDDANLGSVGWFGENGNGNGNNYSVTLDSMEAPAGTVVTQVNIDQVTTLYGTIESAGLFDASTRVGAFVSPLLTPSEYTAKPTLFKTLWMYDVAHVDAGTPSGVLAGVITRFNTTVVDASHITFELDITFSAAQQLLLATGQEILIAIQASDHTLTAPNSDKVTNILYKDVLTRNSDVQGLATWPGEMYIQTHHIEDDDTGFTSVNSYIQAFNLMIAQFEVQLPAYVRTMEGQILARNIVTEEEFIIDRHQLNMISIDIPSGVPGINKQHLFADYESDLQLPTGDKFRRRRIGERIDASPYRWGEHEVTAAEVAAELANVLFSTGFPLADYTPVFMDYLGSGFDYSTMVKASSQIALTPLSYPGTLKYFAVRNNATAAETTGVRWGTQALTAGANTVTFNSTFGSTNYAIIISDLTGGGFENIVKAATGFTIDAISDTTINYLVVGYTAATGFESGVQAVTAGANTVTFNTPLASSDYTLFQKDYLNGANNLSNFVQSANGYTFDAIAAGEIHFIAKIN